MKINYLRLLAHAGQGVKAKMVSDRSSGDPLFRKIADFEADRTNPSTSQLEIAGNTI